MCVCCFTCIAVCDCVCACIAPRGFVCVVCTSKNWSTPPSLNSPNLICLFVWESQSQRKSHRSEALSNHLPCSPISCRGPINVLPKWRTFLVGNLTQHRTPHHKLNTYASMGVHLTLYKWHVSYVSIYFFFFFSIGIYKWLKVSSFLFTATDSFRPSSVPVASGTREALPGADAPGEVLVKARSSKIVSFWMKSCRDSEARRDLLSSGIASESDNPKICLLN